VVSCDTCYS